MIEAHGDHRLAMLGAVAGLASREGVDVVGMDAAAVSYPRFEARPRGVPGSTGRVAGMPVTGEGGGGAVPAAAQGPLELNEGGEGGRGGQTGGGEDKAPRRIAAPRVA